MIGWYVHHHGSGHRVRARTIAPILERLTGEPVVLLSSLDLGAGALRLQADHTGPTDDGRGDTGLDADPTAHGALHWAPRRAPGVADRVAGLAGWIAAERPRAVVVDVSVEAALLVRLTGTPLVVAAMPGDRGDGPHQLAYRAADLVLAFWRREVYDPPWLAEHRTAYVGAVSRFDGRPRVGGPGGVVLLGGTGGEFAAADLVGLSAAGPGEDVWGALCGADVVVSHGGQNALADAAAARARTVVLPQPRPYAEQQRTASALADAGIVVTPAGGNPDWPALLAAARRLDPSAWGRWSTGGGAAQAAAAIAEVAAS